MYIGIWPNSKLRIMPIPGFGCKSSVVEKIFLEYFNNGYPVICSSARSCINLLLEHFELSRNSLVRVPPYASHCVLESVSRIATPLHYSSNEHADVSIVYHQWGIPHEFKPVNAGLIIEDSCDSVYQEPDGMMSLGANYEVWSLPKILGCSAGGIIWCKSLDDASHIQELRDNRNQSPHLQWYLRLYGAKRELFMRYWHGVESISGQLPARALSEILYSFKQYEHIVNQRKKRIDVVCDQFGQNIRKKLYGRLPTCLPLLINEHDDISNHELVLNIGFKHYQKVNDQGISELYKVLPLPVHQDMPLSSLKENIKTLTHARLGI